MFHVLTTIKDILAKVVEKCAKSGSFRSRAGSARDVDLRGRSLVRTSGFPRSDFMIFAESQQSLLQLFTYLEF